jgi:hypothetical protein
MAAPTQQVFTSGTERIARVDALLVELPGTHESIAEIAHVTGSHYQDVSYRAVRMGVWPNTVWLLRDTARVIAISKSRGYMH